jgi:hypothetical protein
MQTKFDPLDVKILKYLFMVQKVTNAQKIKIKIDICVPNQTSTCDN